MATVPTNCWKPVGSGPVGALVWTCPPEIIRPEGAVICTSSIIFGRCLGSHKNGEIVWQPAGPGLTVFQLTHWTSADQLAA